LNNMTPDKTDHMLSGAKCTYSGEGVREITAEQSYCFPLPGYPFRGGRAENGTCLPWYSDFVSFISLNSFIGYETFSISSSHSVMCNIRLEAISKIEKWFEIKDGVES
jgi:hypothetical protein